jgi:segregation and condensation protein A
VAVAVQTPVFEGPFDLLLHLILRDQVDLYDVSLTSIVDAYLATLAAMENLNLDVATEFLLIAATLVDMKARRLLPGSEDGDLDEEFALWEERDQLLARLLECKTFKDAAVVLNHMHDLASSGYPRLAGPDERFIDLAPDSLVGVTPMRLRDAYIRATAPKPIPTIDLFHVAPIRASVVEAVAELMDDLPRIGRITFRDLTAAFVDKLEIVVRFLAVLELFKQGLIDITQISNFGSITIEWTGGDSADAADLALVDMYEG